MPTKNRILQLIISFCLAVPSFIRIHAAEEPSDTIPYIDILHRFDNAKSQQQHAIGDTLLNLLDSLEYLEQPVTLTPQTNPDSVRMLVWYNSAWYFFENEQWQNAVDYNLKALSVAKQFADNKILSEIYHNLGLNYFRLGDFENSAYYFKLTYNLDKKSGDISDMSNTLNCIAFTYFANKQPAVAEQYILEAIRLDSQIDEPEKLSVYLGTASEIYHQMGDDLKAKQYAEQGLKIELKLGRKGQTGKRLSQLADAQIGLGQLAEAKSNLNKAIPLLEESNMVHSVGICENQLGDIYLKEGCKQKAAKHYHTAADIFFEQGDIYSEARAQQGLYNALRDSFPQKAMVQLERYNLLKDSIYNIETQNALSRYNTEYDNDRLRSDIAEARHRQNMYIIFGIIAALLIIIIVILIIFDMRRRHSRSLEALNADITDLQQQNKLLNEWYQNAIQGTNPPTDGELSKADKQFLEKLIDIVNEELEHGIADVDTVASRLRITSQQLRTRLQDIVGETPRSYILNIRMQKARHLLEQNRDMPIAEVAMHCGYDEPSNFIHAFRRHYGVSPSAMRKGN